jgi:hypothetical protein
MAMAGVSLNRNSKLWLSAVAAMMAAAILAASFLSRSFALTAVSDIIQSLLLLSGALAFVPLALRSYGRLRLFWWLIVLGLTFWLAYQLFWTYSEVLLRREVPDLCAWDVVLFLHMVPLMAALGLRPQFSRDEYSARVGRLDFALLLVWWFYLYVLIVMPWQYVLPDISAYNRDLNDVYLAEKLVLLSALLASWIASRGDWKKLYASLFAMSLCYSGASTMANWAIGRKTYYMDCAASEGSESQSRGVRGIDVLRSLGGPLQHDRCVFAAAVRGLGNVGPADSIQGAPIPSVFNSACRILYGSHHPREATDAGP